ncbi:Fic family protein [Chryseobacterium herbae]|uniref:Fic family protein n=1 Tax=Chryseobacterium herbae TaxID=2976476 RepID=A0ABT2IVT7_9FLAO|nr:Fic family protein [Chryseobacterium sp. pc1-10]MCT2562959.1 Fic family protein [Chryseobacterium sp. pc1-10]
MKNIKILEKLDGIKTIDKQKKSIDSHRPFSKELENKIFQKLKLDWNYNSNAIEGNQLSYGETVAFLNFGLTAKGKPFKDHLDIKGHNEAIEFMLQLIKEDRPLSENDIKDLHKIILVEPYLSKTVSPEGVEFQKEIKIGQYKTSPNHVKTVSGDIHYYTNPEDVIFEMNNLLQWYKDAEKENLHPVVISAIFHHKFTSIHPFDDGNGRLARILSNFILLKHNYPVIVIKNKDKIQYYSTLNIADNGIYEDLVNLFAENIAHSFETMQKAINGENINEVDDLDKEIELFVKSQINSSNSLDLEKNQDSIVQKYVINLLNYLLPKLNKFESLFQESYYSFSDLRFSIDDYKSLTDNIKNDNTLLLGEELDVLISFNDHIKDEFNLKLFLVITIKKRTVKYELQINDSIFNSTEYSKMYSYDYDEALIYNEVTTEIVNYIIDFIKKKTKKD